MKKYVKANKGNDFLRIGIGQTFSFTDPKGNEWLYEITDMHVQGPNLEAYLTYTGTNLTTGQVYEDTTSASGFVKNYA